MASGAGPGLQRGLEREQGRTQGAGVNTDTCRVKTCVTLRGSLTAVLAVGFFSCESHRYHFPQNRSLGTMDDPVVWLPLVASAFLPCP